MKHRPEHEYFAISWRSRPITELSREDLLEALHGAYQRLQAIASAPLSNTVDLPRNYRDADAVGIQISADAHHVWVCINGQCVLRASGIKVLELENNAAPSSGGQVYPYQDPEPELKPKLDFVNNRGE